MTEENEIAEILVETTTALGAMDVAALLALEARAEALSAGVRFDVAKETDAGLMEQRRVLERVLDATAGNLRVLRRLSQIHTGEGRERWEP